MRDNKIMLACKAIGNPERFAMLSELAKPLMYVVSDVIVIRPGDKVTLPNEISVKEMSVRIGISHSQCSQHFSQLHAAGLVTRRKEAQTVYYRLAPGFSFPPVIWQSGGVA